MRITSLNKNSIPVSPEIVLEQIVHLDLTAEDPLDKLVEPAVDAADLRVDKEHVVGAKGTEVGKMSSKNETDESDVISSSLKT